jgi:UDP-N-acetylglucosamine--N-acetylmuramyl-(pentapeptide) pyrophosphoryl-undecaprenol N-acetylglucosamine transferase
VLKGLLERPKKPFNTFRASANTELTKDKGESKTICFVAGKSGGHIIPCLTIAENNRSRNNECLDILFFSANTSLDKALLAQDQWVSWHVMLPLSTRTGALLTTIWNALRSFVLSFFYLCKHRPEKIITTGGIVAIPTCIAGFILRIPITLYSLDAIPGKAIQFVTPFATSIVTCFASAQKYFPAQKCSTEPYPIKYHPSDIISKENARKNIGLSPDKKTLLILGGSQGSLFLNNCIKQFINDPLCNAATIQIIHQTGSVDATDWKSLYAAKNITAHVFSYHPNLAALYTAADLIICRAGAGTLFEVKFFNKPCIIIPLKTNTTTHQVDNARAMVTEYPKLFSMILQNEIEQDHKTLFQKITMMLKNT